MIYAKALSEKLSHAVSVECLYQQEGFNACVLVHLLSFWLLS